MKVCYVLSYRSPNYIRTITILQALSRINNLSVCTAINTSRSIFFRYAETMVKLLFIRLHERPDYYILGFRGYEIFWPVRLLTIGKPLIFDHMMSPYDSIMNERQLCRNDGCFDKLIFAYENSLLHHADLILTDTTLHRDYIGKLFALPMDKIHAVPVSTDESVFFRRPDESSQIETNSFFNILFYGSFLPLHGVDIILNAARILSDKPVRFTLIGGEGKRLLRFNEMRKKLNLKNVKHETRVGYDQLPRWINQTDLCLGGPFGNTGQARRVITGKTFQFLSMSKPTVVGKIDADYGFVDQENALVVNQGNGQALAEAILWAYENQEKLPTIGRRGKELYENQFSIDRVKEAFEDILGIHS